MKKVALFVTVAIVIAYLVLTGTDGVELTLKNVGATTLRSVSVDVSGASYALGDIPSGASKMVKINPKWESDIKLRFANSPGLIVGVYVDNEFGGSIEASVTEQKVVAVKDESTFPSLF
jgi:hypothetical protein